ncbi:MAG: PhoH family protein [Gammaproteobacteria bacterium]
MNTNTTTQLTFAPTDNDRLVKLCGQYNEHIHQLELQLDVQIAQRSSTFTIKGTQQAVTQAKDVLTHLYADTQQTIPITPHHIHLYVEETKTQEDSPTKMTHDFSIQTLHGLVKSRGAHQQAYMNNMKNHDINFAIGPAGTGKTYLAVACAVEALQHQKVSRILLVRPAVEAGERLGFLPGDLEQKVDPYLRPLYDALYDMLGFAKVAKLIERHVIEVAPLAYMRGRTLSDAFIILDESQNTTREQMKMFLTRLGFGSKAVITGDVTQIDLPKGIQSGLLHAEKVLKTVKQVSFTYFSAKDAVRHPLLKHIIQAYQDYEQ